MKKIADIYHEYKIMPHLALHQMRVAAVAGFIADNTSLDIDKESLIKAALIHDMGNVVKFDLAHTKEVFGFSDTEIKEFAKIKDEFIEKYGKDDHEANTIIAKEITDSEKIINLVNRNIFKDICLTRSGFDFELKILKYSDCRVGPKGILSYEERMEEAGKRYRNHESQNSFDENIRNQLVACGKDTEQQIFSHCSILPEDITNESVAKYVELLKDYEI